MTTTNDQRRPPSACQATTAAGDPCRGRALAGTDPPRCFAHADEFARARADARQRGGHNRSNAARARAATDPDLTAVLKLLHTTLTDVHAGTLEPRVATAVAQVASALCRVREVALLDARLNALEDAADRRAGLR